MALKYHPDVNKEPDAKDRFMACKTAYQTLSNESDRKKYDRTLDGGGGGGFDWGSFGQGFGQSSSSSSSQSKRPKKEEEDFYGFSQFFDDLSRSASSSFTRLTNVFRDLEKEFTERQAKKTGQPRSLWQELSDIGEEFVEFLEQGVTPSNKAEAKAKAASQERTAADGAEKARKQAAENAEKAAEDAKRKAEQAQKEADDDIEQMLAELKKKASNKSQ